MKKLMLTCIIVFTFSVGFSQLTYEGKVDTDLKSVQLEDGTLKYMNYNRTNQQFVLYNTDQTVWKKIKLPLPQQHILDEIKLISRTTFNKDDLLEIAYSCVEYTHSTDYENTENPLVDIRFTLNIVNEDGKELLKVYDSNEIEIVESDEGRKLLIHQHIENDTDVRDETLIYSLP